MKLLIIIAALIALVATQDSFGFPDKLLADVNPGPNSSYPGTWYQAGDKAYAAVTITGKVFKQIVVTDGTTEGTKLVGDINTSHRGDPYAKDPFWTSSKDSPMQFATFDGVLWVRMYNYDTSSYDIWIVSSYDDILRKYEGGIVKSLETSLSSTEFLNIRNVQIFKDEYFAFSDDVVDHGLHFFDKTFSSYVIFNNASNFMITPSLYDTFAGFGEQSSTFLITEDFLIIEGWVQNYGGLWAYDGTNVWPLNLGTYQFHDDLRVYDSVNQKLYYVAYFNNLPQLVVNDMKNLTANYTILTNLAQDCFPVSQCFSFLNIMDEEQGTVAFAYNTQLGFTDGTLSGTTFWVSTPRISGVLGAYNGKLYFTAYTSGTLMVTDGTLDGTKIALDENLISSFIPFNGIVLLDTGSGMYRLDQNGEFTLIRVIAVSGVWTTVTLKNGNKQLYTNYKDSRSCGRGCTRKTHYIHVSDGNGIVYFSGNFGKTTTIQPVFLNDRFIMTATSESTGAEVYYMDAAQESYVTPPPVPETPNSGVPGTVTSDAARPTAVYLYLFLLITFIML